MIGVGVVVRGEYVGGLVVVAGEIGGDVIGLQEFCEGVANGIAPRLGEFGVSLLVGGEVGGNLEAVGGR